MLRLLVVPSLRSAVLLAGALFAVLNRSGLMSSSHRAAWCLHSTSAIRFVEITTNRSQERCFD